MILRNLGILGTNTVSNESDIEGQKTGREGGKKVSTTNLCT